MSDKPEIDETSRWCVLLPCSREEIWAVPQKCLAEIVTLPAETTVPPEYFTWRGQEVPVIDLDHQGVTPWRDKRASTGLVAVMLGLQGGGWKYFGVALRGEGLGMKDLARENIEEAPESKLAGCVSAFKMAGKIYQVPELQELHKRGELSLSAA